MFIACISNMCLPTHMNFDDNFSCRRYRWYHVPAGTYDMYFMKSGERMHLQAHVIPKVLRSLVFCFLTCYAFIFHECCFKYVPAGTIFYKIILVVFTLSNMCLQAHKNVYANFLYIRYWCYVPARGYDKYYMKVVLKHVTVGTYFFWSVDQRVSL